MPVPSQEQGSLRNLLVIQHTLQHVISRGFRCAVLWAPGWESCRPVGTGDITATSYPCLPCTAGFISLIPIPAFSLLFSSEGRELCWRLVLPAVEEALSLSGRAVSAHWLFPDGLTLLQGDTGTPPQQWSGSGRVWDPLPCLGGLYLHIFAYSSASFADSALPKHLVLRMAFCSHILAAPALGQCISTSASLTGQALLQLVQCGILRTADTSAVPRSSCASCHQLCHQVHLLGWAGLWACPQPQPSCSVLDNSEAL